VIFYASNYSSLEIRMHRWIGCK